MDQQELIEKSLKIIKEKNIEGEIFLIDSKSTRVTVSSGKAENLEERQDRGCGIRILNNKKIGFSYTSEWNLSYLNEAIEKAYAFSHLSTLDEFNEFPEPSKVQPLETYDPSILEISTQQKIRFAMTIEESARSYDKRIKKVKSANYKDLIGQMRLSNTYGMDVSYKIGRVVGSIELSGTDGTSPQLGFHHSFGMTLQDLDPIDIGQSAARKAIEKLGAREFKTASSRVILSNEATANLFVEINPLFSAKNILKKKSILEGKIGNQLGSKAITILDNGRKKEGFLAAPFDGEGTPTRETAIIREGVLENYLHNYSTALKMNHEPTGNCVRASYAEMPKIGITNLYIKPSKMTPEDLIRTAHSGVYITELLGLHTIDNITGDFSIGAIGMIIENGKLSYPIHQIALSGNILTLLNLVEGVANDLRFFAWSGGGVSILFGKMTVSGI